MFHIFSSGRGGAGGGGSGGAGGNRFLASVRRKQRGIAASQSLKKNTSLSQMNENHSSRNGLAVSWTPSIKGRSRWHGLHQGRPEHPFCFFGGALRAQREGIDQPEAVRAICSNGILSICLCAERPASTSHGPTTRRMWGSWMYHAPFCLASSGQVASSSSPDEEHRLSAQTQEEKKMEIEGLAWIACCLCWTCLLRIAGRNACHPRRIQHCTLDVVLANQT